MSKTLYHPAFKNVVTVIDDDATEELAEAIELGWLEHEPDYDADQPIPHEENPALAAQAPAEGAAPVAIEQQQPATEAPVETAEPAEGTPAEPVSAPAETPEAPAEAAE